MRIFRQFQEKVVVGGYCLHRTKYPQRKVTQLTANFLFNEIILISENSNGYVSNLFKLRQKAPGLSYILSYV